MSRPPRAVVRHRSEACAPPDFSCTCSDVSLICRSKSLCPFGGAQACQSRARCGLPVTGREGSALDSGVRASSSSELSTGLMQGGAVWRFLLGFFFFLAKSYVPSLENNFFFFFPCNTLLQL